MGNRTDTYSDTLSETYLAAAPIAPIFMRVCPVMLKVFCVIFVLGKCLRGCQGIVRCLSGKFYAVEI
jgi:hypothetical protein